MEMEKTIRGKREISLTPLVLVRNVFGLVGFELVSAGDVVANGIQWRAAA